MDFIAYLTLGICSIYIFVWISWKSSKESSKPTRKRTANSVYYLLRSRDGKLH